MLSQKTINDFIFIFFVIYIIPIIIGSFVFILTRIKKKKLDLNHNSYIKYLYHSHKKYKVLHKERTFRIKNQ